MQQDVRNAGAPRNYDVQHTDRLKKHGGHSRECLSRVFRELDCEHVV